VVHASAERAVVDGFWTETKRQTLARSLRCADTNSRMPPSRAAVALIHSSATATSSEIAIAQRVVSMPWVAISARRLAAGDSASSPEAS
jgi:hypothetical protein